MIRPLVVGNWKMNLDHVEAIHLTQQIGVLMRQHAHEHVDVMIAAPFVDMRSVSSVIEADRLGIALAAQHVSALDNGAHTGEISVSMLKRLSVSAVIVGHSERRAMYAMDDRVVAATFDAVQRAEMTPIVCVGESLEVREAGDHESHVIDQVRRALAGVGERPYVVAYEPIWAIGTGVVAETAQVAEMMQCVRSALPTGHAERTPILYGGSVKSDNAVELSRHGAVDGFLVGGASLKADEFIAIVSAVNDCYPRTR